jgi:hypothetical protein
MIRLKPTLHFFFQFTTSRKLVATYNGKLFLMSPKTSLSENLDIYLHVVCEYADTVYVEFVTAYIPDELEWENPPIRRRKRKKK